MESEFYFFYLYFSFFLLYDLFETLQIFFTILLQFFLREMIQEICNFDLL